MKNSSWLYRVASNNFCTYERCHLLRDDLLTRVTLWFKACSKNANPCRTLEPVYSCAKKKCEGVKMSSVIICWLYEYHF